MGEVGIHLEDVVVSVAQGPFETGNVCGSKSEFPGPFNEIEPVRKFLLQRFDNGGRPVRGAVVDDEYLVSSIEGEHLADYPFDVLLLVVGRDYDNFPVAHFQCYFLVSASISLTAASSCLSSPLSTDAGSL